MLLCGEPIYPKNWGGGGGQTRANTVNPDKTPQNDPGLHCLSLIHLFWTHEHVVKWTFNV